MAARAEQAADEKADAIARDEATADDDYRIDGNRYVEAADATVQFEHREGSRTIRVMICASIDVIIQAAPLRDGSRRITHITEVMGMEGDTIITQDIFLYDMMGEDANGKIIGRHRSTGIGRPKFWERARYYGEEKRLAAALDAAEVAAKT